VTSTSRQCVGSWPRTLVVPLVPARKGPSSVIDSTASPSTRARLSMSETNAQTVRRSASATTECVSSHDMVTPHRVLERPARDASMLPPEGHRANGSVAAHDGGEHGRDDEHHDE